MSSVKLCPELEENDEDLKKLASWLEKIRKQKRARRLRDSHSPRRRSFTGNGQANLVALKPRACHICFGNGAGRMQCVQDS